MEEIRKAIDSIHGDMIAAMAQMEITIEALSGGNTHYGDVACSLMILKEYIDKRADTLEAIAKGRFKAGSGIPT